MPKYKNKTEFTRPVSITGKRLALKPNDIVFSDRELDLTIYDFLEIVDESQKITSVKELSPQKITIVKPEQINKVQSQVDALKSTPEDIKKIVVDVEKILKRMEILKSAVESVGLENTNLLKAIENINSENVQLKETVESFKHIIQELQTEVYENGVVIIEDIDEKEQK